VSAPAPDLLTVAREVAAEAEQVDVTDSSSLIPSFAHLRAFVERFIELAERGDVR